MEMERVLSARVVPRGAHTPQKVVVTAGAVPGKFPKITAV